MNNSHGLAEAFILPVFLIAYFIPSISSVIFLISLGFSSVSCFHYKREVILRFLKGQLTKPYFDFKRKLSTLLYPQNGFLLKISP